ncbi:hypothetical protein NTE_03375 [Candidatus Nitrososphaera evergladensis SR1]|uniref:Uncharacterized protein n=1 Tax=Candidatus Nitrososphaera evergladensis SR1 TaxID=1459636 RepID=A0A075MW87_9ARCH|nr:hypothetical protein [Candidatus Nitrososphaera evergladensis]AIF85403.1 hypothetical protein NTE_03375 [Candidatus Nitrososphaera evergladensis SR1]
MKKINQAQHRSDGNDNDDNYSTSIREATLGTAVQSRRLVNYNSKAFRILEQLFKASEPKHSSYRFATRAERNAMRRLVRAGLIKAETEEESMHDNNSNCCITSSSHLYTKYSITLAGRAHYVAAELGLSFPQLCYLACARNAVHNFIFTDDRVFFAKDVYTIFGLVFKDISPSITRWELARKGFLARYAWHISSLVRPHFVELERRYATVMDELYHWMKKEYDRQFAEAMHDPVIAKIVVGPAQPPITEGKRAE